ncbi:MAG: Hsp20/alpha crystallin family protein [bacterium]|nr:Hsp20/alpha crystallin family protein [bacterium]
MANLIKWEPERDLFDFDSDMRKLFGDYFMTKRGKNQGLAAWSPLVDIEESKDEYTIKADVPGMKKEDIKISLQDHKLILHGERKEEKEEKKKDYVMKEMEYGSFFRSFDLPYSVNPKDIKASYVNGILTVHVPKTEEVKEKEVKIEVK